MPNYFGQTAIPSVKHQPAPVPNEDFLEKHHKLQEGAGVALPLLGTL